MTIFTIDPGGKHVGLAQWTDEGELMDADVFTQEQALHMLTHGLYHLVVIENYRLDPERSAAQSRSDMPTSQLIGRMKGIIEALEIPYRMQEPSCKNVARKSPWRGMAKPVKNRHAKDAVLHGIFYFGFERKLYGRADVIR